MTALTSPDHAPLDPDAYKHQWLLLKALHAAHPVMLEGRSCFIQVLSARQDGGRVSMDVYLAGDPVAIDSAEISVLAQPK